MSPMKPGRWRSVGWPSEMLQIISSNWSKRGASFRPKSSGLSLAKVCHADYGLSRDPIMMQIGESDLTYATPRTRIWKSWRILLLVILSFVLPFAGEATFWLLHKLEILQTLRPKSLKATFSITL